METLKQPSLTYESPLYQGSVCSRPYALWLAIRTPFLVAVLSGCVLTNEALVPNLLLLFNYYSSPEVPNAVQQWGIDKLLHISNVVPLAANILAIVMLLEIKPFLRFQSNSIRGDLLTALIGLLFVSLAPLTFVFHNSRTLAIGQTALGWLFFMLNAQLYSLTGLFARHNWLNRVLDWTFPLSDLAFYIYQRGRIGAAGIWRLLPSLTVFSLLVFVVISEGRILALGTKARRLAIAWQGPPLDYTYYLEYDRNGFWLANSNWKDATSGIWYYDENLGEGHPYIHVFDLNNFRLVDGYFYYYDRLPGQIFKVDAATRDVVWKTTMPRGFGTFEIAVNSNLTVAAGENGYIVAFNPSGSLVAERRFPHKTENIAILPGNRIVFLAGDLRVRILNSDLSDSETLQLPLRRGVLTLEDSLARRRLMRATTWTQYDERSHKLYIATFWGDIFSYDVQGRVWGPTIRTRPGIRSFAVDSKNDLIFVSNYSRGYIDVIDLRSQRTRKYIIAQGLGRHINLNPAEKSGILHTRGRGMYWFDYSDVAASPSGAILSPQLSRRSGL
jgi:hypothetical protein